MKFSDWHKSFLGLESLGMLCVFAALLFLVGLCFISPQDILNFLRTEVCYTPVILKVSSCKSLIKFRF